MRKIICPININTKAKAKKYFWGINFTLISVSTVIKFAFWRGGEEVQGNLSKNDLSVGKVHDNQILKNS